MKIVQIELEQIRNEYTGMLAKSLAGKITQDDFNKILTGVDDFVLALKTNNIITMKAIEDIPLVTDNQLEEFTPSNDSLLEQPFEPDQPVEQSEDVDEFEEAPEDNSALKEMYEKKDS